MFRLIAAAQSWHWVAGEMRFAKAAEMLSPDGTLAVFGQVLVGLPASLGGRFEDVYRRHIGAWGPPPEAWYLPEGPVTGLFDESGVFGPVEHRGYRWPWRHTASSFTALLRTRSDHRMLDPAKREEILGAVGRAIDDHGGVFEADYETHLYLAHRLS